MVKTSSLELDHVKDASCKKFLALIFKQMLSSINASLIKFNKKKNLLLNLLRAF